MTSNGENGFNLDDETYEEHQKVIEDLLHGTKVKVFHEDL